jgi:hypothetical protein
MSTPTVELENEIPDSLLEAALRLPDKARARFASALIRSLDGAEDDPEEVRAEWQAEIAKRVEDLRSGAVQPVDGRAFLLETRQRIRDTHGV